MEKGGGIGKRRRVRRCARPLRTLPVVLTSEAPSSDGILLFALPASLDQKSEELKRKISPQVGLSENATECEL